MDSALLFYVIRNTRVQSAPRGAPAQSPPTLSSVCGAKTLQCFRMHPEGQVDGVSPPCEVFGREYTEQCSCMLPEEQVDGVSPPCGVFGARIHCTVFHTWTFYTLRSR